MSDDLLTIDDIASILKLSRPYVKDVVVRRPGFPERSPASGMRKPRWSRDAVMHYISGRSAQNANNAREAA